MDHPLVICGKCKEQIINFYNFKIKVKLNLNQTLDVQTNEIIEEVKEFLSRKSEKMTVLKQETSLSIVEASTLGL